MKFIGIIPSRYESTRFPGKPLIDIGGKTMIRRVYEQAKLSLDNVFVATPNDNILKEVESFGGQAIITNPSHPSGTDRCSEAADILKSKGIDFDIVINIQGDEPFIDPEQIEDLKKCFNNQEVEIATLVRKIKDKENIFNPNIVKVVFNKKKEAIYFSRSAIPFARGVQQEDWLKNFDFYNHIGIYGYKYETLKEITSLSSSSLEKIESLEQLRWLENGYKIKIGVTEYESFGIDTPEDLEKVKDKYGSKN